ncbi:hypothetical protein D3C81_219440 [compost metagenome]
MGGPCQTGLFFPAGMPQLGRDRLQGGNVGIRVVFVAAFDVGSGEYQGAGQGIDSCSSRGSE